LDWGGAGGTAAGVVWDAGGEADGDEGAGGHGPSATPPGAGGTSAFEEDAAGGFAGCASGLVRVFWQGSSGDGGFGCIGAGGSWRGRGFEGSGGCGMTTGPGGNTGGGGGAGSAAGEEV